MELLPRITRAQSMDVLSSQANLAGYRAVIEAAAAFERGFPMMMTAAGTVRPPVSSSSAPASPGCRRSPPPAGSARSCPRPMCVRPPRRRSVARRQLCRRRGRGNAPSRPAPMPSEMSEASARSRRELMATTVAKNDIVICTALVMGRKAPVIVTQAMVDSMRHGSVIVDLASDAGGNAPRPSRARRSPRRTG